MNNDLFLQLKRLSLIIKEKISDEIAENILKPEKIECFRWKVDEFNYNYKTGHPLRAHEENYFKDSWFRAKFQVLDDIRKFNEYDLTLNLLKNIFLKNDRVYFNINSKLDSYLFQLITLCLSNSKIRHKDINDLIEIFITELNGHRVIYGAKIELEGIRLQPKQVEFNESFILRWPEIKDIEKEYCDKIENKELTVPEAVLYMEFLGKSFNDILIELEYAMVILRLFKIGNVRWIYHKRFSESIIDNLAHGTYFSDFKPLYFRRYVLYNDEIGKFKVFWNKINECMPSNLYNFSELDDAYDLKVAYNRYYEFLFRDCPSIEKISFIVRGLEALFIKSNEGNTKNLYDRVGKFFSLWTNDLSKTEIKNLIKNAHGIRSDFVHYGYLKNKRKEIFESELNKLLYLLPEYLRISIVLMIIVDKSKNEFINLINESLIKKEKEEELKNIIAELKGFVITYSFNAEEEHNPLKDIIK